VLRQLFLCLRALLATCSVSKTYFLCACVCVLVSGQCHIPTIIMSYAFFIFFSHSPSFRASFASGVQVPFYLGRLERGLSHSVSSLFSILTCRDKTKKKSSFSKKSSGRKRKSKKRKILRKSSPTSSPPNERFGGCREHVSCSSQFDCYAISTMVSGGKGLEFLT